MTMSATRDEQAIRDARLLQSRIRAAVDVDYPGLCGWAMRLDPIRRTGTGEDDWAWDGSARAKAKRARKFLTEAVAVAARRISQAYGLGAGSEWARKHFGRAGDERLAVASHVGPAAADGVAKSIGLDTGS